MKSKVVFCLIVFLVLSCKKTESSSDSIIDDVSTSDGVTTSDGVVDYYPEGTYCSYITYFNPNTGTSSNYTLNVEVENNEVTVIQWPNGGWLDSTHFQLKQLDDSGHCFITSYDGIQYDIQIKGAECTFTDDSKVMNDINKVTCPDCGGKKYSYEDRCDDCQNKMEHTCQRCGQHDSFMWKDDELCSDCKRADEE